MHLTFRNVNEAFYGLVKLFRDGGYSDAFRTYDNLITCKASRNGGVRMIEEPVLITYTHPQERVLFDPNRDANPFFHLYEALWMLAGRNDVASVAYYASNMANYSDNGKTLNGAYGYRWRHCNYNGKGSPLEPGWADDPDCDKPIDQLDTLVNHLKADPNSRRAVLQMWNVEDDLLKIGGDRVPLTKEQDPRDWSEGDNENRPYTLSKGSKDVCCNLSVMFSLRDNLEPNKFQKRALEEGAVVTAALAQRNRPKLLDMTVTNRSNDLIWGLLGSNYVHFSILQEYIAARLGVEVGKFHTLTNNLHVYENNWKPDEWLEHEWDWVNLPIGPPLVKDSATFERELPKFVRYHEQSQVLFEIFEEPFLNTVATPMMHAFHSYKRKNYESAFTWCGYIEAPDWKRAATEWIQRRKGRHDARKETVSANQD